MIVFKCPRCNKTLTAADSAPGQVIRCDSCQTSLRVPPPAIAEEAPASPITEMPSAPILSPPPPTGSEWRDRPDALSADKPPRPASRTWLWVLLLVGGVLMVGFLACVGSVRVGYWLLRPRLTNAKQNVDLAQTKVLTQACESYMLENGQWPPNLEALTQPRPNGGRPLIDNSALEARSVPNGRFQYDAGGPRNGGRKPDIWVDGPHGKVGNWMTSPVRK